MHHYTTIFFNFFFCYPPTHKDPRKMHRKIIDKPREKSEVQYLVVDNIHFASWFQTGFTMKPEHQAHPQ